MGEEGVGWEKEKERDLVSSSRLEHLCYTCSYYSMQPRTEDR